jgi:transposase InsO family protein
MSELFPSTQEPGAGVPPPASKPAAAGVAPPDSGPVWACADDQLVDIDWQAAEPAPAGDPPAAATGPTGTHAAADHGDRPPGFPGVDGDDTLVEIDWQETAEPAPPPPPCLGGRPKGRRLVPSKGTKHPALTPQQRLLLLDTWRRSGLPAGDFAALVGLSKHTLYAWKKKFDSDGPAGLLDQPRGGPSGSKLPDLTRRTILLLKQAHPEWGCQRISDLLVRGPALPASAGAVARVLHEAGYELEEVTTRPHPDQVRSFERAQPNQLWQTDLFTFVLKRQNRRVYLVAFLDDHSRFLVSYGLHASQSTALVLEVLRAGLANYGAPQEILTDNGSQYVTWRGKSAFTKELEKQGIRQIVAAPRRPQTLGKIERFWGTLWRECLASAVFLDLGDAQRRLGLFIDYYNLQRPHQGIGGLVPADRFFGAAPEVLQTLKARVAVNALELARHGLPKTPFYLTGQVGGQPFSVHAEGERVILTGAEGRREVDLVAPPAAMAEASAVLPEPLCPAGTVSGVGAEPANAAAPAPGTSALDAGVPPTAVGLSDTEGGGA